MDPKDAFDYLMQETDEIARLEKEASQVRYAAIAVSATNEKLKDEIERRQNLALKNGVEIKRLQDLAVEKSAEIARLRAFLIRIDAVAVRKQKGAAPKMQRYARLALASKEEK